jgi:hypothetical protein
MFYFGHVSKQLKSLLSPSPWAGGKKILSTNLAYNREENGEKLGIFKGH